MEQFEIYKEENDGPVKCFSCEELVDQGDPSTYLFCTYCNSMTSHILCLVEKFTTDMLPTHGNCPNCEKMLIWGELIQASKLRHKQMLEQESGIIEMDEPEEGDIEEEEEEEENDEASGIISAEEYEDDGNYNMPIQDDDDVHDISNHYDIEEEEEEEFEILENGELIKRKLDESFNVLRAPKRKKDDLWDDDIELNQNSKVRKGHSTAMYKSTSANVVSLSEDDLDDIPLVNYCNKDYRSKRNSIIEIQDEEGNDSDSSVINLT